MYLYLWSRTIIVDVIALDLRSRAITHDVPLKGVIQSYIIIPADCDFGNSGLGMCGWQPEIVNTWYDPYWQITDDFYMKVRVLPW